MSESLDYSSINSRFGTIGVNWKETPIVKVQRIILQDNNSHHHILNHKNHPQIQDLCARAPAEQYQLTVVLLAMLETQKLPEL